MTMVHRWPAQIDVYPTGPRGIPGTPGDYDYKSKGYAATQTIAAGRTTLRTGGYLVEGDGGGALYKRVAGDPGHIGAFTSNAGTVWWEIVVEDRLNICQVGASTTGTNANNDAVFAAISKVSKAILVPPKKKFNFSNPLLIDPDADWQVDGTLQGLVQPNSDYFRTINNADTVTTVGTPGNFTPYPIGTTTYPAVATAFQVGQWAITRLAPGAGAPTWPDGITEGNQGGLELRQITEADATHIKFATGSKYPFDVPRFQQANGGYTSAITVRNQTWSIPIPASMTLTLAMLPLVVLVHNTDGTDSVRGSKNYYELKRVIDIVAGSMVFDTPFAYNMTNPWVAETRLAKGISVRGSGYIDNFQMYCAEGIEYDGLRGRVFGGDGCYGGRAASRVKSDQPRGLGASRCYNMEFINLYSHGSRGITDNAAFKTLGNVGCIFNGFMAYDTASATAQGVFDVFADYYFPPYYSWQQDCIFNTGRGTKPSAGADRSAGFAGCRDCIIDTIIMNSNILFEYSDGLVIDTIQTNGYVDFKDSANFVVNNVKAKNVMISGLLDSLITTIVTTGFSDTSKAALWIRGGAINLNTLGVDIRSIKMIGVEGTSSSIAVQACDYVNIGFASDKPGNLKSLNLLSSTSVGVHMSIEGRGLRNPIDSTPSEYVPTVFGGTVAGTVAYNGETNSNIQYDGRFCNIRGSTISITLPASGAPTGEFRVNLPRKAKNSPSASQNLWATYSNGATVALTGVQLYLSVQPGLGYAVLRQIAATGADTPFVFPSGVGTPTLVVRFGGMYEVENYSDGT
jgi:hypothetical protein